MLSAMNSGNYPTGPVLAATRPSSSRVASLFALAVLLGGCAVSRLEDLPTSAAIDAQAPRTQASLSTPPADYMTAALPGPAPSLEQSTGEAAGLASPAPDGVTGSFAEPAPAPPNGFVPGTLPEGATWLVRYRAEGFDAEDADGNYCSGQVMNGSAAPRPGLKVELACNNGGMAQLVIGSSDGLSGTGKIVLGTEEQKAVIR